MAEKSIMVDGVELSMTYAKCSTCGHTQGHHHGDWCDELGCSCKAWSPTKTISRVSLLGRIAALAALPFASIAPTAGKILSAEHYEELLSNSRIGADLEREGGWGALVAGLRALQSQGFSAFYTHTGAIHSIQSVIDFRPGARII